MSAATSRSVGAAGTPEIRGPARISPRQGGVTNRTSPDGRRKRSGDREHPPEEPDPTIEDQAEDLSRKSREADEPSDEEGHIDYLV